MLRRKPTRLELKLDDIEEFESIRKDLEIISLFWTNMNGPYNYHNEHYGEKAGETVEWMYFSKIPFHQWQMVNGPSWMLLLIDPAKEKSLIQNRKAWKETNKAFLPLYGEPEIAT
ncbi:anaphase-promoting complex subunit CDC26 isoform 1-T2 [Callospermophilus lateralis]|uniref:anaphase-promoting complex subunit CDC26 isoform X1 n=1 Tax=Callospermophilus lateralis TaxID=76772 RepID=UPI004038E799